MGRKAKKKEDSQPSIKAAFRSPRSPSNPAWKGTTNATESSGKADDPHLDPEIRSNEDGRLIIASVSKQTLDNWKERRSRELQKWIKKYHGPTHGFTKEERVLPPGQTGFKTGRIILTRMITQNPIKNPSMLAQYQKLIKSIWDDRALLSRGPQGDMLREFVMRAAATDPIEFFENDWDSEEQLYANEDTKVWYVIQKLTGLHCIRARRDALADATGIEKDDEVDEQAEIDEEDDVEKVKKSNKKDKKKQQKQQIYPQELPQTRMKVPLKHAFTLREIHK